MDVVGLSAMTLGIDNYGTLHSLDECREDALPTLLRVLTAYGMRRKDWDSECRQLPAFFPPLFN